ncbi:DNA polymerase zeta [Dionaea muscipula]
MEGTILECLDNIGDSSSVYLAGSMESPADSREKLFSEFTPVCSLAPTLKTNDENHGSPSSGKSDEMAVAMQVEQGKGDVTAVAMQDEQGILKLEDKTQTSQDNSQISGPSWRSPLTPLSQLGFRDPASVGRGQQLTLISIEVQAECRGDLRPDPHFDAINIVTMAIENDDPNSEVHVLLRSSTNSCCRNIDGVSGCNVLAFPEEKDLVNHFAKIMCSFDPDIIMGWDVQGGSLGFLAERSSILGVCLLNKISRTPSVIKIDEGLEKGNEDAMVSGHLVTNPIVHREPVIEDEWGRTHASGVHVGGRIVLNVWRLIRGEVKLNMYTVEAVVEAVLRRKLPSIQLTVLNKWFLSGQGRARYKCIDYMAERAKLNIEIVNTLDMINRTSELARVFGIDFFSVLSRGSQYRVESMLIRLAHAQNYVAISPGYEQVACQPAMECLPLVMEPESGFYTDPVIVLDFQSLYPSIIIAYNLCFCTCLGKIVPSKADVLGVSIYSPDLQVLRKLNQEILVTPNGVMYVPSKVRKGVLPRLLEEILSTRVMVKQAMKSLTSPQQILHRIFNARQLALKLIANVTYGYTAAGFSGRMPCAELADSIVQCGRRTLENAISVVNGHDKWKARVIYGDTDSMFVLVEGRNLCEAFQIGQEIASTITAMNPNPVTLKMEKVYQPCFLLTKKRYVGYSYESPEQVEPIFDAKGIETVRRDTCGAVAKILEKTLRLFFEHQDISEIKAYLQRQWSRILSGRVSLQDFVFSKEVRLGTYSTRASSSVPPAAIVATKAMRADPRAEPRYGERVPYVVIHGEPGARLVDMVVDPLDLLAIDSPYRLNDLYYIKKQIIPALQRVFGLVGADLNRWFLEMPRPVRDAPSKRHFDPLNPQRTRIDYYYSSQHCVLCGDLVQAGRHLCEQCSKKGAAGAAAAAVTGRTSKLERDIQHLAAICRHCGGGDWIVESGVKCTSLACPVFYERRKVQKELRALSAIAAEEGLYPKCMIEWF